MRSARSHRYNLTGLLLILLYVALASCDVPNPLPKVEKTPQPRPNSQQTLRILGVGAKGVLLNSLDPATAYFSEEFQITQLVFPSLVTLDGRMQPVDWAAERHEVSADGLTYTFHLRKGLRWSDGAPIDAATFAYSINRGLDPCLNSYTAFYVYLVYLSAISRPSKALKPTITSSVPSARNHPQRRSSALHFSRPIH
jgi:oligopeptide transport system substrate-binding protein